MIKKIKKNLTVSGYIGLLSVIVFGFLVTGGVAVGRRSLVRFCYRHSPKVADFIRDKEFLKKIGREFLNPVIWIIRYLQN